MMAFLGIDLAASPNRPTGFCTLMGLECVTGIVKSDEEIIRLADADPKIIAIDSPLSFSSNDKPFRKCDLEARRRGFPVLPLSMSSMKKLAVRGIKLKEEFNRMGFQVIEVFPTGAFLALNITPPKRGVEKTIKGLRELGLVFSNEKTIHELDAMISAYVAYKYHRGEVEILGDAEEGTIVIPKSEKSAP